MLGLYTSVHNNILVYAIQSERLGVVLNLTDHAKLGNLWNACQGLFKEVINITKQSDFV